jgi:hypothetical protein
VIHGDEDGAVPSSVQLAVASVPHMASGRSGIIVPS